jgi:hypothetical protein
LNKNHSWHDIRCAGALVFGAWSEDGVAIRSRLEDEHLCKRGKLMDNRALVIREEGVGHSHNEMVALMYQ